MAERRRVDRQAFRLSPASNGDRRPLRLTLRERKATVSIRKPVGSNRLPTGAGLLPGSVSLRWRRAGAIEVHAFHGTHLLSRQRREPSRFTLQKNRRFA